MAERGLGGYASTRIVAQHLQRRLTVSAYIQAHETHALTEAVGGTQDAPATAIAARSLRGALPLLLVLLPLPLPLLLRKILLGEALHIHRGQES